MWGRYTVFMILLLSGAKDIARAVLIERLLKEHAEWRHIALEDLECLPFFEALPPDEQVKLSASLALTCAQELIEQGFHIVLSRIDAGSVLSALREEMGSTPLITVHIGSPEQGADFGHSIDTINRSASDVFQQLEKIIAKAAEM